MEMMKSAVMEKVALNFFKEIGGSEKEPETNKSGGEQKQGHGHDFYFCYFILSSQSFATQLFTFRYKIK
jgi:hypothetical protein